jgi:hypothetical protein
MVCNNCGSELNENNICPNCSTPATDPGKVLGIVGMISGIVAVLSNACACGCGFAALLGGPLSLVGLGISIYAMKKSKAAGFSNGMATAGMITSIVAIVFGVIAAAIAALGSLGMIATGSMNA